MGQQSRGQIRAKHGHGPAGHGPAGHGPAEHGPAEHGPAEHTSPPSALANRPALLHSLFSSGLSLPPYPSRSTMALSAFPSPRHFHNLKVGGGHY